MAKKVEKDINSEAKEEKLVKTTTRKTSTTKKTSATKKTSTTKKPSTAKKSSLKKAEDKEIDAKEEIKEEVKEDNLVAKKEEVQEVKIKKPRRKKALMVLLISFIVLIGMLVLTYFNIFKNNDNSGKKPNKPIVNPDLPKLPKPELAEGERGQLGIDKNVNEKAIDKYLNRDDSVYRDMRMLEDPAEYESIGGDRYLSGYVKGFEVVPLPYIIPVKNLPKEVGSTYSGNTLFYQMSDGSYVPMYEESMKLIEELFPKDKIIFLMCGGGGYAGMMKEFLVSQGWDKDSIYVVGGHWYYKGKNNIEVPKKRNQYGTYDYDFSNVPYHEIKFEDLTQIMPDRHTENIKPFFLDEEYYGGKDEEFDDLIEKYNNIYTDYNKLHPKYNEDEYEEFYEERMKNVVDYINKLMKDKKTFVITVYNDLGCGDDDDTIRTKALKFFEKHNIYTYDMGAELMLETDIAKDVQNAPNVIIFKNGKIYTFYYNESDEDLKINKSEEATAKWLQKYILTKDE